MISLTDTQKIGMGLTGFGVFFLFFGMILFFWQSTAGDWKCSVCGWFGFCNWSRKNIQILLPEAQSESHWIFPGWCVRGPYWLAFDRHDLRNLRILSLVQGLFPSGGWLYQKSACPWIPPESPWNQIIRRQGRRKQQYGITTRELKNLNTVLFIKPFWRIFSTKLNFTN